jgi:glycerophosphoryl diester phosphodiesterase
MARVNKLYEKPLITSIALTDRVTVGQLVDGEYKVKTMLYSDFLAQIVDDTLVLVVTRAQLQALITASSLAIGVRYIITNAVGSTLVLLVEAVAVNVLDEIAVNTTNGENYIYDITTDTATQSENEIPFNITSPANGQGLFYDSTDSEWKNKSLTSTKETLTITSGDNSINLDANTLLSKNGGMNLFPHRGVIAFGAPENSLISLYHSYLLGARVIEFDVNYTSDGVLVLLHDDSLNSQFTNSDGSPIVGTVNINDITYAQALTYIRSSNIDGYKTTITTLDDFLRDCAKYNITPLLELKSVFPENLDNTLINLTRKYFRDENIWLQSFSDDVIIRLKNATGYYPVFNSGDIDLASEYRGAVFLSKSLITSLIVSECAEKNVPLLAYTVSSQSDMNDLLALGVNNMTTEYIGTEKIDGLTYIDSWESGLSFTDATVASGSISSGESLVTLNNVGTLQTPSIRYSTYGNISAEVIVEGTCTIKLYLNGSLDSTITNTSTTAKSFYFNKLVNASADSYILITSTQSNCKVISLIIRSGTFTQSIENRKFKQTVRSDRGFNINGNLAGDRFIHFRSGVTSTPSLATWDEFSIDGFQSYADAQTPEYMAGLASDSSAIRTAFIGKRAKGTLAAPTALGNAYPIVGYFGSGYDGTSFKSFGSLEFITDGAASSGVVPIAMTFNTGSTSRTEKARITSSGRFLFGTTTDSGSMFQIVGTTAITGNATITGSLLTTLGVSVGGSVSSTINLQIAKSITGNTTFYNVSSNSTIQSDVTSNVQMYRSEPSTVNSSFTISTIIGYQSGFGTKGASSTISEFINYNASDSTVATTTKAYAGNVTTGTNKWNLYMGGTASNYLAGNTLIGSATPTAGAEKLQVTGTANITGALAIGNTITTSVATPSTHKVTIVIGGVTYYLLATNI